MPSRWILRFFLFCNTTDQQWKQDLARSTVAFTNWFYRRWRTVLEHRGQTQFAVRGWARIMCKHFSPVQDVSQGILSRSFHRGNNCARYCFGFSYFSSNSITRLPILLERHFSCLQDTMLIIELLIQMHVPDTIVAVFVRSNLKIWVR